MTSELILRGRTTPEINTSYTISSSSTTSRGLFLPITFHAISSIVFFSQASCASINMMFVTPQPPRGTHWPVPSANLPQQRALSPPTSSNHLLHPHTPQGSRVVLVGGGGGGGALATSARTGVCSIHVFILVFQPPRKQNKINFTRNLMKSKSYFCNKKSVKTCINYFIPIMKLNT